MAGISRDSLLTLEAYARERKDFRARVLAHKKRTQRDEAGFYARSAATGHAMPIARETVRRELGIPAECEAEAQHLEDDERALIPASGHGRTAGHTPDLLRSLP